MWSEIIKKSFEADDPVVVEEIIKGSNYKIKGSLTLDLYVYTDKNFVAVKIKNNISKIKEAIQFLEDKTINEVYIDNVKREVKIEKLHSKHDINILDLSSMDEYGSSELSGENDIVNELFEYEESVIEKNKVTLHMHQKEWKKEWKQEVSMSVIKNKLSFKRRSISKKLKELTSLRYMPLNNDTKEVLNLLNIDFNY